MDATGGNPIDRPILAWLASEARLGNDTALRELLRRLQRPVLGYLAGLLDSTADAQDAWQEAALAISAGIGGLKDTAMVRAWAFRIARFKAMDALRGRRRRGETALDESLAADGPSPATALDAATLLDHLGPDDRALVTLFYLHGFSLAEIASALGISAGAARVRLFRARGKLKQHFEGDSP